MSMLPAHPGAGSVVDQWPPSAFVSGTRRCATLHKLLEVRRREGTLVIGCSMSAVTLTSKRQATFHKEVCEELGLKPGDQFELERIVINGHAAWVLKVQRPDWSWIGAAAPRDASISHDLADIRASIGRGVAAKRRAGKQKR
jgi:hypothetical protein